MFGGDALKDVFFQEWKLQQYIEKLRLQEGEFGGLLGVSLQLHALKAYLQLFVKSTLPSSGIVSSQSGITNPSWSEFIGHVGLAYLNACYWAFK